MAQNHRTPRADVVGVARVLHIPKIGALRFFDKARRAAHGFEGAHGRINTARDAALGAFKKGGIGLVLVHKQGFTLGNRGLRGCCYFVKVLGYSGLQLGKMIAIDRIALVYSAVNLTIE